MALKRRAGKGSSGSNKAGKKGSKDQQRTRFEDFEKPEAPEKSTTSGAARRAAAKAALLAKPAPKRLAKNNTDTRAKGHGKAQSSASAADTGKKDKHAKTKHEFIQRKKADALAQHKQDKQQAKAATKQTKVKINPSDVPALAPSPTEPTRTFIAVAGSYERLLYGLLGSATRSDQGVIIVHLQPQFMFPAHVSSIRTAACAGTASRWLATGGNDESIKVWDLKKKVEVGGLTGHTGTITSVHFPSRGFLITSSEDGLINVYRAREWSLLATLKGHKGPVHDVATHPSGKVALSVGKDRTVRMWDLMRGVAAASTKIPVPADKVAWDSHGARFAVVSGPSLQVYDTTMNLVGELKTRVRWHDVRFYSFADAQGTNHEALLAAGEDKQVHVFDVEHPFEQEGVPTFREVANLVGHGNRVKSVAILPVVVEEEVVPLGITASSDGLVRAFDLSSLGDTLLHKSESKPIEIPVAGEYSTKGTRLTCLSAAGIVDEVQRGKAKGRGKGIQIDESTGASDEELFDDDEQEEEYDTDAEEEELKNLQQQIEDAKKEGFLEEYSSSDEGNGDAGDEDDSAAELGDGQEAESESEPEVEDEPEEESE